MRKIKKNHKDYVSFIFLNIKSYREFKLNDQTLYDESNGGICTFRNKPKVRNIVAKLLNF